MVTKVSRKQQMIQELEAAFGLKELGREPERPLTFREFVDKAYPRYQWYRHCEVLCNVLQRVADGDLKRVMVFMPPRHGKSQLATRLFPGYFLYRHLHKWVGINSYASELAYTFSRAARDAYRESGALLRDDACAVKHWETTDGGGLWAAGVGGPITGKGFTLGVIDDPLKNQEEAFSDRIRDKQKDWYDSTFYTRGEADAAIVVILTRWHSDDLAGWLLKQELTLEEPERWHIVNFEAIKEEEPPQFPSSCTVEPDWREPGEPLCPERFNLKKLLKIKAKNSYFWSALYQQRPVPREGGMIQQAWFGRYRTPPARFEQIVMSWDTASKASELSCPWSCTVWGIWGGNYYLLYVFTKRMEFPEGKRTAGNLMLQWKPAAVLIEDKSTGQSLIQELRANGVEDEHRKKHYFSVIPIEPCGDKLTRMSVESPAVEAGRVWLPETAPWLPDYEMVMTTFPLSAIADPVDSTSQFLRWVREHSVSLDDATTTGDVRSAYVLDDW